MNVLGLHLGHDTTAALIVNDRLVASVQKERLTRIKHDRGFLPKMLDDCLAIGGISFEEIDYVSVSLFSGADSDILYQNSSDYWGITIKKEGLSYRNGPRQLTPWACEKGITVKYKGIEKPAYQIQHHVAHAASVFYTSSYDKAIALTYDGSGVPDNTTSLICIGEGTKIKPDICPALNGALLYGQISYSIYKDFYSSGKLMGIAAYGKPSVYKDKFMENPSVAGMIDNLSGITDRENWSSFYKNHWTNIKDIAASAQKWMEEDVKRVLSYIEEKFGDVNLVVSGGGVLNVLCNRIIYDRFPSLFSNPFVQDEGIAHGGALYVLHHIHNKPRQKYTMAELSFLGDGDSSWAWTKSTQLHLETEIDIKEIAKDLSESKVVLWHQGRSEAGPRALTHRSIFAEATNKMKKRVSIDIKGREEYRPLAPIVLEEDCEEYFDVKPNPLTEVMLLNAKVLSKKIPGVTHIDGTARVQTISKEFNPIVHKLLTEYKKITGIPVLINTSLNIQGQPICETEFDTLWTFDNCEAEVCVINNKVYRKPLKAKKEEK